VTNRRRAEEEIRHLSRRLIAGIEEERRRLAADLHDEFGQSLTALHLWVESLKKSFEPEQLEQISRCDKLRTAIEQIVERMRKVSSELRPDMLDHLGLVPTAEWFVGDFQRYLEGVQVDFQAVGFGQRRLDPELEIVFYRILQEALNNVAKHAGASHVSVNLTYSHPKAIMVIKDDGRGFEPEGRRPHENGIGGIGLVSMKERVAAVGGTLDIRSSLGAGVMIRVSAPAQRAETPPAARAAAAQEG
jgi:signal transduction histidine kinase